MFAEVVSLALGNEHSLLLKEDGSVWSTAMSSRSLGSYFSRLIPSGATALAAGKFSSMALLQDGGVWSTRKGSAGPLKGETIIGENTVFFVQKITGARSLAAGGYHSMLMTQNGRVRAMGWNKYGQLGDGSKLDKSRFFVVINNGMKVVAVAAGGVHSIVLRQDGSVWAVGRNYNGQLGDGSTNDRSIFLRVIVSDVAAVAAGGYHSMVVKQNGAVWTTGCNEYGQLGDGSRTDSANYMEVVSYGAKAVAAGSYHSMILKQDGSVWATGYNEYGQLGDGSTTNTVAFVEVMYHGVKTVAAGAFHSMVLKQDGSVWATGSNQNGQFGDGSTMSVKTFIRLAPFGDGVVHNHNHTFTFTITNYIVSPHCILRLALPLLLAPRSVCIRMCAFYVTTNAGSKVVFASTSATAARATPVAGAEATAGGELD